MPDSKRIILKVKTLQKEYKVKRTSTLAELLEKENVQDREKYLVAQYCNGLISLNAELDYDCDNVLLYTFETIHGYRAYMRSIQFVLLKAVKDLFPDKEVIFEHSLSKGLYGRIKGLKNISRQLIGEITAQMRNIIDQDLTFTVENKNILEIMDLAIKNGWKDKEQLYKYAERQQLSWYKLDTLEDYFFGPLVPSTKYVKTFELRYYPHGFILRFPETKIDQIPEFREQKKIFNIFSEHENWGEIMGVPDIGSLNDVIESGDNEIINLISIAESLQEKKISYIADKIVQDPNIRLITIAGPSSSGKTTFSKRLRIQLLVTGHKSITISLDNYFLDREKTPRDEKGDYDFEALEALDLAQFNSDILDLMDGRPVNLLKYDFKTGKSEKSHKTTQIDGNTMIIVEGIHGLNDKLTSEIPAPMKFKIYVSALTQLNIDNHNRIHTTDNRLIRRLVRDYKYRKYDALETFKRWPSVRRGEDRNIFPYQESADVIFNSALIYELAILKTKAEPLLRSIPPDVEEYLEARRLLELLSFFHAIDDHSVPSKSILREFIGGSMFRY